MDHKKIKTSIESLREEIKNLQAQNNDLKNHNSAILSNYIPKVKIENLYVN